MSITWKKQEMTCVAICPETEIENPRTCRLPGKFSRTRSHVAALLVLVAGLLGLSTQLQATLACTRVDDGGWYCREVVDYSPGFSQGGGGTPPSQGSGGTGGETGFGEGGSALPAGTSPDNPREAEEVAQCGPSIRLWREAQASQVVRDQVCAIHRDANFGFWRVNWSDGTSGLYQAELSCLESVFLVEIEAPDC